MEQNNPKTGTGEELTGTSNAWATAHPSFFSISCRCFSPSSASPSQSISHTESGHAL